MPLEKKLRSTYIYDQYIMTMNEYDNDNEYYFI